jgi:hypothetical protein
VSIFGRNDGFWAGWKRKKRGLARVACEVEVEKKKGLRVVLSALEFERSWLPVTTTATV